MPDFPPLFKGRAVVEDPYAAAIMAAAEGCEAGLILHRPCDITLDAALVLAPDVCLADAAAMLLVATNGFADAFGALSPPEIALHVEWPATLRVEGARCGGLRAAAPECADGEVPGWLVIGLRVPLLRSDDGEPGERPEETDLREEGVLLSADDLIGAWARHTLSWIARWEDEGIAPVHRDWTGRAWRLGGETTVDTPAGRRTGTFQGLDETGGILLKGLDGTIIVPLTEVLDRRPC